MKLDPGTVISALIIALAGGTAFVAWRTYKTGTDKIAGFGRDVVQLADQAVANVQSAWVNNVSSPYQRGQDYMAGLETAVSSKAWLYSGENYTGIDNHTGTPIIEGEWYSDAVARHYDAEQRARGATPPATSIGGAAFGIYPKAF